MEAAVRSVEEELRRMSPVAVPREQQGQVAALSRALVDIAQTTPQAPRCKLVGPAGEEIALPESVFFVLERVVEVLARGDALTVVPVGRELTTQQAANVLNVSRQYLVRLLNDGRIPFRKTGKHRRLRVEDVLSFKEGRDAQRRASLRELSRLTQELGGYDAELT